MKIQISARRNLKFSTRNSSSNLASSLTKSNSLKFTCIVVSSGALWTIASTEAARQPSSPSTSPNLIGTKRLN